MGLLSASCSFSRFRIIDAIPQDLWTWIPDRLKQFAIQDIDDIPEERAWGWTNIDDMLDTAWRSSPPDRGEYLAFALRLDTRRIPVAVLKKHLLIATREEEIHMKEQGKKFMGRERRQEIRDLVRLRLMQRFLPIPAVFDVIWNTSSNTVYLGSSQTKVIELFMNHFTLSFDLHLEPITPYSMAMTILDEETMNKADWIEATSFV